ncbi:MAG: glycosyltransferase family A protein [Bacteroidota bacterium]|nr:glycosyltransferase family 2 protein [Candidatus Kapabacteria bacterium]MDW8220116.1 glycosyltransferase family A protein [Bacteroidota bacterium]
MYRPFFSVIVCTYNRAHTLSRALESLLCQVETDWECLIVDDGSTDATQDVAVRYMWNDKRVRIMKHQNSGVGYSRTVGMYASLGQYCTFLDSDDEYLPLHLSSRREILERFPEIDILHGGVEVIGIPFVRDRFDASKNIHVSECVLEGTMVLRREVALKLEGFGTIRYGEGAVLLERASELGLRIMKVEIPTYRYDRTTPDSLCSRFGDTLAFSSDSQNSEVQ